MFVDNLGDTGSDENIGGLQPGAGNIISGSTGSAGGYGVDIFGPAVAGTSGGNDVQGNLIGVDGQNNSASNTIGIYVQNSSGNVIGGPGAAERNVISANSQAGVEISGDYSTRNAIDANFIGIDVGGTERPGDTPANSRAFPVQTYGVYIITPSPISSFSGPNNVISDNVISGNLIGVNIAGVGSSASGSAAAQGVPMGQDVVEGNFIGTNRTGMKSDPNFEYGVYIDDSAANTIGGVTAAAAECDLCERH